MIKQSTMACITIGIFLLAGCTQSPIEPGNVKNYDTTIYESVNFNDETTLYDELGGMEVIENVVSDAVDIWAADQRIGHFFANTDLDLLKSRIANQVCQLAQGPCEYGGRSMEAAHSGMGVREADFIALVEGLQRAIKQNGLSYNLENKILALLAPMKRAIVNG